MFLTMASYFFGKKSSQNSIDYKSRLEHKLYLAREDPEPVFDLSECNLKSVPSGVYSLCKVFRKERLLLQVNQLVSLSGGGHLSDLGLITYLDLHNNHLSTLSEDIGYLKNLQELNVSTNELKTLPSAISSLINLKVLDCSFNKLRGLPPSFDRLTNLNSLDLRGNTSLQALPPVLSKLTCLKNLSVDSRLTEALPSSLIKQATPVILQQLGKECNPSPILQEDCMKVEKLEKLNSAMPTKTTANCQLQKAQDFLAVERQLQKQKGKEIDLHNSMKQDKDKLLLSVVEQQRKLEHDVNQFHIQKEQDRTKLLSHLVEVEKCMEEAIEDLLVLNQALRSSQWQQEEELEQKLLLDYKTKSDELRRKEVLDAMQSLLTEEYARKEKFLTYEKTRGEALQNSLAKEVEWGEQVIAMLHARDCQQSELLVSLDTDSEMQKALVVTLLQQTDLRSQGLVMQVALVEQQLAVLTAVELQRRNMDSQQQLSNLAENRKTLSELLLTLLQEQRERQRHLINELHQLEVDQEARVNCPDFWLRQYQCLMTSQPSQLLSVLDPQLIHQLVSAKVFHYLPALATCNLQTLSRTNLSQVGITDSEDQLAILEAVKTYLTHNEEQLLPSAPPQEVLYKPAPAREPLPECVICMERECAIVFVPCGHLCSCLSCATQLLLCPLCRAPLERKIHVIIP